WNIWSNGYNEQSVTFPETGEYKFEIIAKGSYAGGSWPNMELRLNQSAVQSFTVDSTSWGTYVVTASVPAGSRNVAVAFTNEYFSPPDDRKLYVDKVIISKPGLGAYEQPNDSQGIVSMEVENSDGAYAVSGKSW